MAVTSLLLLSDDIGGVVDPTDNDNFTAATVLICAGLPPLLSASHCEMLPGKMNNRL
ncbi:MAG: hypothetical protein IPN56_13115 [Chitinophagaceae bacterium]|nr:hypothetical protein [Chitinophagaceae bacterium]